MGGRPKHGRKSTDGDDPVSPGKARSTKRRKTAHVENDGIAAAYAEQLQAAEASLKTDMSAMEAHMAHEEAMYSAAMERIVNARREAAVWRAERMSQWDATRRELMARQQDAELAAELARMRVKKAREAKSHDRMDRRKERIKKRAAELKRAEAERAARQQPEVVLEDDICFLSEFDDDSMGAEDDTMSSGMGDNDNDSLVSADTLSDDGTDDRKFPRSPIGEKIEVDQGDESDDDLEVDIDELSNHSDYVTDDDSRAPTSSTLDREASARRAWERAQYLERQARARAELEQAEADRERLRRERELRAKQEAAWRDQQEKLRREQQERSRRDQQERARRDYEQQQQRATEDSRRSQSRRPINSLSGATAAWARYTSQWAKLQGMGASGTRTADAILYFSNIPWPTIRAPRHPDDITKEAVAALVLSSSHSHDKSTKARLRELLLLWHPDKFVGRWMSFVVPADQPDVTEGVMAVARIANELLSERNLR